VTILAIGAHPDDVILSAGAWLSWHTDVVVATVFAGDPDHDAPLTAYDREAGFNTAGEAMEARREEDRNACKIIGALPQHLPLLDGQYRGEHPYDHKLLVKVLLAIADELKPTLIVGPLGIVHSDHVAVGSAAWHAFKGRPECQYVCAEDLPYRVDDPAAAVFEVAAKGLQWFWPEQCPDDERALQTKIASLECYTSQLWAMPSFTYFVPERFWLCP